jgi:serine protease AprX
VSLRVPGSFVDVAHPEGRVGALQFRGSGTSQAAAVVGAAAAVLVGDRPGLTPDQVKFLLVSSARAIPNVDAGRQGGGIVDMGQAGRAVTPSATVAAQSWPVSDGSGSLELARGSYHLSDPSGAIIFGERTVWDGQSWSGQSWSGQSWSGQSWSGGSWSGQSWSGGTWLGQSWSGQSWSGQSWSGQSWSGQSWSGQSWSGQSWSGQSWSSLLPGA